MLQACVLLGMFLALRKTQVKLHAVTERLEDAVLPLIATSRGLVDDLSPKVKVITTNLVGASDTLRKQAEHVGNVVSDVTARTQHQTARVDSMISQTLDKVGSATATVERNIAGPLRKVNGVLAGLRAGVETLRTNQAVATKPVVKKAAPVVPPASTPAAARPAAPAYSAPAPPDPADITPEEAREAAARFVRDRAAAERR